jgi:phospholipid/cholesterol/gamma-HCH transport system permease protein
VEIGTMSVDGEIDALRIMGIDPYRYLGVPRFWGVTISVVCLYILIVIFAVLGGCLFSQLYTDIAWQNIWRFFIDALQGVDLVTGLVKAAMFGMIISTVSIDAGFEARDDMGEVANKTAESSLWSLVLCGAMDIVITNAYYLYPHPPSLSPLSGLPLLFLC